jgi:hypothetical protein
VGEGKTAPGPPPFEQKAGEEESMTLDPEEEGTGYLWYCSGHLLFCLSHTFFFLTPFFILILKVSSCLDIQVAVN